MEIELLLLLLLSLLLSALFSASEIAFIVANRLKIEVRARKKVGGAETALRFIKNPESFFSTVLVGNNIANVAYSSIATALFGTLFGWSEYTILAVVSCSVLLAGEILPKAIVREIADFVIIGAALFIRLTRIMLYPFVRFSEISSRFVLSLFKLQTTHISRLITRSDIDSAVRESRRTGSVGREGGALITKAIALAEQHVSEVMIPRTEILAVDQSATIQQVIRTFRRSGYSRLPVYKDTLDQIVGVVFAHDLFQKPRSLKAIMRDVLFVPETKRSVDLLREFRRQGLTIAVCVDEYGGTAGMVTTEDLIEELVGEIHDEYDVEEIVCKKLDERTFLLSGRVEVDRLVESFELDIPYGDYETIAGFVLYSTGSFPKEGEVIETDRFRITVEEATRNRILLVRLEVLPESANETVINH